MRGKPSRQRGPQGGVCLRSSKEPVRLRQEPEGEEKEVNGAPDPGGPCSFTEMGVTGVLGREDEIVCLKDDPSCRNENSLGWGRLRGERGDQLGAPAVTQREDGSWARRCQKGLSSRNILLLLIILNRGNTHNIKLTIATIFKRTVQWR